jgi:hypothetical protein
MRFHHLIDQRKKAQGEKEAAPSKEMKMMEI